MDAGLAAILASTVTFLGTALIPWAKEASDRRKAAAREVHERRIAALQALTTVVLAADDAGDKVEKKLLLDMRSRGTDLYMLVPPNSAARKTLENIMFHESRVDVHDLKTLINELRPDIIDPHAARKRWQLRPRGLRPQPPGQSPRGS